MVISKTCHKTRLGKPFPRSIAVLRALQLGDMLCAVPSLRALRFAFPKATITLIGLRWAKAFTRRFSCYIDRFIEFPGYPGLPEREPAIRQIPDFFQEMQRECFDLALQMHGSGTYVNSIISLFGAKRIAGFYRAGEYCPDPDRFMQFPEYGPEIWKHLRLMEHLGIALKGDRLEFPVTPHDREELSGIAGMDELLSKEYICIHPGSRAPARRWTPEGFAEVANALARSGYHIVLTGSAEEESLTSAVSRRIRVPHTNLAGMTSMGGLAALVSKARLVVCNDTGISHIADALAVPSVVIVTGSDPDRWRPLDRERHKILAHPVACRPCAHYECPFDHLCAAKVTGEMVIAQARELLLREGCYAA